MRSTSSPLAVSMMIGRAVVGGAQAPADRQAVLAGHHQVEHDQVGRFAQHQAVERLAVLGQDDLEALLGQIAAQQVADAGVVVNDQDLVGSGCSLGHGAPKWICNRADSEGLVAAIAGFPRSLDTVLQMLPRAARVHSGGVNRHATSGRLVNHEAVPHPCSSRDCSRMQRRGAVARCPARAEARPAAAQIAPDNRSPRASSPPRRGPSCAASFTSTVTADCPPRAPERPHEHQNCAPRDRSPCGRSRRPHRPPRQPRPERPAAAERAAAVGQRPRSKCSRTC